jgi:hypothetical protein
VITLNAVVACEIALQGREHRDAELVRSLVDVLKELFESLPFLGPAPDDEAVLGEGRDGIALVVAQRGDRLGARSFGEPVEKRRDVVSDHQLCVGEGVEQEYVVAGRASERHTNVEHRRLHACSSGRADIFRLGVQLSRPVFWGPARPRLSHKVQRVFRQEFGCRKSPMKTEEMRSMAVKPAGPKDSLDMLGWLIRRPCEQLNG